MQELLSLKKAEEVASGNRNYIYLGRCASHEEAEIEWKIAAFYCGRRTSRLDFDGGDHFFIPPMSSEEQEGLSVPEQRAFMGENEGEGGL